MKFLLFLLLATLLAASPVLSQTRKAARAKAKPAPRVEKSNKTGKPIVYSSSEAAPPPPPPAPKKASKERSSSDAFKDVSIRKWGVAGLSLPEDLTNETESSEPIANKNVSWTTYSRSWKQAAEFYPSALEADLNVTTWNADFKTLVPELKPELATPENFILMDLLGDSNNKNEADSFVKETKAMVVNGVNGAFFRADSPSGNNRFMIGWTTYRYYENKAQRISLVITGRKDEMEKALKIIKSLKLQ
jgi:hypothetical protein